MEHMDELYERTPMGIKNEIQVKLGMVHDDFFDKYSGEFGALVEKDPELLARYEENQEETLKKIEDIFYH